MTASLQPEWLCDFVPAATRAVYQSQMQRNRLGVDRPLAH